METTLKPAEILAIGAHPDDVEIACGGTVAKMAAMGHSVGIIDLTAGEMGTRGSAEIRIRESLAAAGILGAVFRANLHMPDTQLRNAPENEKPLVEALRTVRPRVVLAPLGGDTHPDHTEAAALVQSAWYKAGFGKYDSVLQPFRPARLIRYMLGQEAPPAFVVDISDHIEKRRAALAAYESQLYGKNAEKFSGKTRISSPAFLDMIETRIKYFGQRICKAYGEPFAMKELPEIADPGALTDATWVFKE